VWSLRGNEFSTPLVTGILTRNSCFLCVLYLWVQHFAVCFQRDMEYATVRSHKKIHHNQSNSSQIQHIVPSYSIHGWKWQVAGSLSNLPRKEIGFGTVDQTWSQGLAPKCLPCRVGGFWSVISVLGNECYPWISTEKHYKRLIKWVYEYRGKWDKDLQLWRFRVSQSSMSISYFERV
jgi:hypothetical protein